MNNQQNHITNLIIYMAGPGEEELKAVFQEFCRLRGESTSGAIKRLIRAEMEAGEDNVRDCGIAQQIVEARKR